MINHSEDFIANANSALLDYDQVKRRDLLGRFIPEQQRAAREELPEYEALRTHVKAVRQHALDNLDHYLLRFEEQALANGAEVHFARSGHEMNELVLGICQAAGAERVAKGKSMVTEETNLNQHLLQAGLTVRETDLGEYIIQQAGEAPSHIVVPALHKSQEDVRELFLRQHPLGNRELANAKDMVDEARGVLREQFLKADVGIIGSNALIADSGYSLLVSNEGNGDLCANLPDTLIICTTIDRILPRAEDALAMQRLLVRSAIGQAVTSYSSFYGGPRRAEDSDGPKEVHFILLDNARSDILASDFNEILHCIRCGSCLTHCPVYIGAGGHAYGSVYPGPMGSVLTPLLTSLEQSAVLASACTTCGRCEEVCPAAIPLPDMLRELRHLELEKKLPSRRFRLGLRLHAWLCSKPRLYQFSSAVLMKMLARLGRRRGRFKRLPLAGAWTVNRDMPAPEGATFMAQYRQLEGEDLD